MSRRREAKHQICAGRCRDAVPYSSNLCVSNRNCNSLSAPANGGWTNQDTSRERILLFPIDLYVISEPIPDF